MVGGEIYEFGDYRLDRAQRKLSRAGAPVAVEPKALDLLLYLAQHRDRAVGKEELQDALSPRAILTESALTRCVMKARRAVGDNRERQDVIRTVHGHGYQFIAELAEPSARAPDVRVSRRRWSWVAVAGLAIVGAVSTALLRDREPAPPALPALTQDRSIAVLPFVGRSSQAENAQFFGDGVHDDLLTLLSKVGDLRVVSRTSTERYRGTNKSIPTIADELGVSTIVEGGVQVAGDRIRINAQLIDAATDQHLWAETYDRRLSAENIFEVQAEIARSIALALRAKLSPIEERVLATTPTRNLDALYAYQRGQQAFDQTTGTSLEAAKTYFQEALDQDPQFAAAMVGLAYTHIYLPTFGAFPAAEGYGRARELIEAALAVDPNLGEAYGALAILLGRTGDTDGSVAALEQGLELAPNSSLMLITHAMTMNRMGRGSDAVATARKAMQVDPILPLPYLVYGDTLESLGRLKEAQAQYERTIEIDPDSPRGYASVGDTYIETGDIVSGVKWTREALVRGPDEAWLYSRLARVYMDLGDLGTAARFSERSLSLSPGASLSIVTAAYLALREGNDAATREYAGRLRGRLRSAGFNLRRILHLRDGDTAAAVALYEDGYPEWFREAFPAVTATNYRTAVNVAGLLLRDGRESESGRLLEAAWDATRGLPLLGQYGRGIVDAEILALMGDADAAAEALRGAVAAGWRLRWWLHTELNPNLDSLREHPVYLDSLTRIREDMAAQLAQLEALEGEALAPLPGFEMAIRE